MIPMMGALAVSKESGTLTYSTAGTYSFTVPDCDVLAVTLNGSGGASGNSGQAGGNGNQSAIIPVSYSSFCTANGGSGGGFGSSGAAGTASINAGLTGTATTGGGNAGGDDVLGNNDGGRGGRASFSNLMGETTFNPALEPVTVIAGLELSIILGAGGVAVAQGLDGTPGSVTLTWS